MRKCIQGNYECISGMFCTFCGLIGQKVFGGIPLTFHYTTHVVVGGIILQRKRYIRETNPVVVRV